MSTQFKQRYGPTDHSMADGETDEKSKLPPVIPSSDIRRGFRFNLSLDDLAEFLPDPDPAPEGE